MVAQTHIRTDKDTLSRLKVLAGDKSLNSLLRDIASGVELPALTRDEIADRLDTISEQITELQENFLGLDETWWNSFMKHEKDVLMMGTIVGLLASAIEQGNPEKFKDLQLIIRDQAKEIVDRDWQKHLDKHGFYEEDGKIKRNR